MACYFFILKASNGITNCITASNLNLLSSPFEASNRISSCITDFNLNLLTRYRVFLILSAICAPGEVYEACPYRCDDLCDVLAQQSSACSNSPATNPCVPYCRPTGLTCAPGEKLKDKNTCVPASRCPCRMQNGTIASVSTSKIFTNRTFN